MSRYDLNERLSQMVASAEKECVAEQEAIARRWARKGMLNSGNFFLDEKRALESIYERALRGMETHALSLAAPSAAAIAVRTAGLELESRFVVRFDAILSGTANGNPLDPTASGELGSDFRAFARKRLLQVVGDTSSNVLGKPLRGWQGWLSRYGWNLVNTAIALAALYWSWGK
jgi:hypothetical protein